MRRTLLIAAGLMLAASLAFAQAGVVQVTADNTELQSCNILDEGSGLVIVYVFHINTEGSLGCQFKLEQVDGSTLSQLGGADPGPFLLIGDPQTGCSVAYYTCQSSPIQALRINYLTAGTSAACSRIHVVPDPEADPPGIYSVDCTDNKLIATGGDAYINNDGSCPCNIVPTEATTWGQIKALYQD